MTDALIRPSAPGDLGRWLRGQARRERGARRLEDALLGDRYASYFVYRLRYFVLRTIIGAFVHAIRVALLFGAFSRSDFLLVILAGAVAAVVGDAWWGALERLRGRIRVLQASGGSHLAPREIASWLRLATRLTALGLGLAGMSVAWAVLATGNGLDPAELMVVGIIAGAALELTLRTYHSGVYALRRIYRPLPSLIVVDVVSLGLLLGLWPIIGLWAFPIAEIGSLVAVMAISLRYTGRTYRAIGFPRLVALLRLPGIRVPSRPVLRSAVAPGSAYAMVGLEAIVLMAVLAAASPGGEAGDASMVALLAALGPVIRAGFEWARLLYFDLVRMGLPLLADLRQRFDRAVLRLALLVGLVTWVAAAGVGVIVLEVRDATLLGVLLPFFVVRSLLAAAQMRSFAGGAYRRLTIVGLAGLAAFGVALVVVPGVEGRVLALAAVLGVSALALIVLPEPLGPDDLVQPLAVWLAALREVQGPVLVTSVRFDGRSLARGAPREQRETEAWRRRQVARRVGRASHQVGGQVTWLSEVDLAWWVPAGRFGREAGRADPDAAPASRQSNRAARDLADPAWVAQLTGGLIVAPPRVHTYPDGIGAAHAVGAGPLGVDPDVRDLAESELVAEFARRFPSGIVYRVDQPTPAALATLDSRERATAFRAGLRFVRDLDAQGGDGGAFDVSASSVGGALRLLFLIPIAERRAARRRWSQAMRERTLRSAAFGSGASRGML